MSRRIPTEKRNDIVKMLKRGKSLNEISSLTNISRQTIYYYFKKLRIKGIDRIKTNLNNLEDVGEFLGIFAGDGYANVDKQRHYQVRLFFNIKEKPYIRHVESLLTKLFSKKPFRMTWKPYNVVILKYNSREIYNLVLEYLQWKPSGKGSKSRTVGLMRIEYSDGFKIGFLRGLLDSDGYINQNRIEFATASSELSKNTKTFLSTLNIRFKSSIRYDKRSNRAPMHIINVNKPYRKKFLNVIKPRNAPGGIFGKTA